MRIKERGWPAVPHAFERPRGPGLGKANTVDNLEAMLTSAEDAALVRRWQVGLGSLAVGEQLYG